jgi:inner membrane protein
MDNLTHSLIGAALGQAGLKRRTGLAMPALIIAANIPDIDAVCVVYGVESLAMRRGITHGPIAMLVLPLLLALGLRWFDGWQARRGKRPANRLPVDFKWLLALCYLGTLTHPLFDWFNNYGVRLLEPFSSQWFYGDTLFIIDPWIIAMLGAGVWFSLKRERAKLANWTRPARWAVLGTGLYAAFNGILSFATVNYHSADLPRNVDLVFTKPAAIFSWQREIIAGRQNRWYVLSGNGEQWVPLADRYCRWPDTRELVKQHTDLAAFLFWSRAPFVTPTPDGKGVVFNDARFYDEFTRGRFAVTLPEVSCQ